MDLSTLVDIALWSAAVIGAVFAIGRILGDFLDFADEAFDADIGRQGRSRAEDRDLANGLLIVVAVLLTGYCIYFAVTDWQAALDNLLFFVAATVAGACWFAGVIALRARASTADD